MSRAIHPNDTPEPVRFTCECGAQWTQTVRHYDVIQCSCRLRVWALRPRRNGPLVGYQHPGVKEGTVWVSA